MKKLLLLLIRLPWCNPCNFCITTFCNTTALLSLLSCKFIFWRAAATANYSRASRVCDIFFGNVSHSLWWMKTTKNKKRKLRQFFSLDFFFFQFYVRTTNIYLPFGNLIFLVSMTVDKTKSKKLRIWGLYRSKDQVSWKTDAFITSELSNHGKAKIIFFNKYKND